MASYRDSADYYPYQYQEEEPLYQQYHYTHQHPPPQVYRQSYDYMSAPPSAPPTPRRSAPRSQRTSRSNTRSRSHTAASSSAGSNESDTEFLSHTDHEHHPVPVPRVAGHEYGPYAHLSRPAGLEMERQYSDDSQKYASSSGSHSSGHAYVHPERQRARTGSIAARGGIAYAATPYTATPRTAQQSYSPSISGQTFNSADLIKQPGYSANTAMESHFLYDTKEAEPDDYMHNPTPHDDIADKRSCTILSMRGFLNVLALLLIMLALVGMFGAYPIIDQITKLSGSYHGAWNLGGTNSSGQVPAIPGLPSLVDKDTPSSAMSRTGFDGHDYNLVFSDEFEEDGRTFWPGDDPYWEAVDLHYWTTGDREWYDPDAVTTRNGAMEITITKESIHDLEYRSGMVQSWNKMCFQGGYIEVRVQLPGSSQIGGFWPGAWTMGNLVRAGYGATSEGVWPFSYNSCDLGTLRNQTHPDGTPVAAAGLSYQPGQKLSACTCKGEEHPGPSNNVGRGGPEIDILEVSTQIHNGVKGGEVSQSAQIAPYDHQYGWSQQSPATRIKNPNKTWYNSYVGGVYQEAVSALTLVDDADYEVQGGYGVFGFEYQPGVDDDSHITWAYNGEETWTVTAATFGPDPQTLVAQRPVSTEPMYMILNLAMSDSFQTIEFDALQFPSKMRIDYVRVYQREGQTKLGCDPEDHPTAKYISDHINAFTVANLTTWEQAGYEFPKNRLIDDC